MTGPLPAPGRTGVRIEGDHYQWLTAWSGCLTALYEAGARPANPVLAVEVEASNAGNLDDVVLRRAAPPHSFMQVKYAVDATSPVNTDWLTRPSPSGGPCLLAKTAAAWRRVTGEGAAADLAIVTNRAPDPGDILVAGRKARTGLLMPAAGEQTSRSARGQARAAWAQAAQLSEDELLLTMLGLLRFDLARDLAQVEREVSLQMLVCGLHGNAEAVRAGADWIASRVRAGHVRIDVPAIARAVDQLGLRVDRAWTALSVATLTPDPLAAEAQYALNWVDRFDGDDPYFKRQPGPPATWQELQEDIEEFPAHLAGVIRVAVTGSIRQATAFTIGAALRMVPGVEIAVAQRGQMWTSTVDYAAPLSPHVETIDIDIDIGTGDDLAVAIEVATPIVDDVRDFLLEADIVVARLVALSPPTGPKDNAIADAAAANAFAIGLRNAIRKAIRGHSHVHLFLAGPMGLSLLLGHRWNRMAPTIVYEDLGAAIGYGPAFTIAA